VKTFIDMKEFVLVEFLFTRDEAGFELGKLNLLGPDFIHLGNDYESEGDSESGITEEYIRVFGKINSMAASLIKLQNPALSGKMRISYISDELKDRYRRSFPLR